MIIVLLSIGDVAGICLIVHVYFKFSYILVQFCVFRLIEIEFDGASVILALAMTVTQWQSHGETLVKLYAYNMLIGKVVLCPGCGPSADRKWEVREFNGGIVDWCLSVMCLGNQL